MLHLEQKDLPKGMTTLFKSDGRVSNFVLYLCNRTVEEVKVSISHAKAGDDSDDFSQYLFYDTFISNTVTINLPIILECGDTLNIRTDAEGISANLYCNNS